MHSLVLTFVALLIAVRGLADTRAELPPTIAAAECTGDCDGDGMVTIGELTNGVESVLESWHVLCPLLRPASISGLLRAVGYALDGCPPPTVADFSDFERFELLRGVNYGYCPEIGALQAAVILHAPDASYVVKRSIAESGTSGVDRCVLPDPFGECVVSRVEPCRTLTGDEVARVRTAFAAITVRAGPTSLCCCDDSCVVVSARWDGVLLGDHSCNERRFLDQDELRVLTLLDSLGAGPERPCPAGLCGPGDLALCNDGNALGGDGCAADCSDEVPSSPTAVKQQQ